MKALASVLIVDDQADNRMLLQMLFCDLYDVHTFSGGTDLFSYLDGGGEADLILLDIMMQGMNGHEVCQRLKASPAWQEIPVIFLTGLESKEEEERGLAMGAVDFVLKPFSPAAVMASVRNHLSLRQDVASKNGKGASQYNLKVAMPQNQCTPDWQALEKKLQGNTVLLVRYLAAILSDHEHTLSRLNQAIDGRDRGTLIFLAHQLKGLAGNLEVSLLFEQARSIEKSAKEGNEMVFDSARPLASSAEQLFACLRSKIEQE